MPKRRDRDWADESEEEAEVPPCWLCQRPLGTRIEQHHPVPKSRKGRETVAVHAICHQTLHAHFGNKELAAIGVDADRLRADPRLAGFLTWIADKPADFHAATHRSNARPAGWKAKGRG